MKRLLLLLACTIFTFYYAKGQTALYTPDSVLKYLAATAEPPANWFEPGFNDSGWITDTAAIGFGEPLFPVDPSAKSIYARFSFNIVNKANAKAFNFFIDYDDGYIAYLNGKEIARVNVDKSIKYPAYNDLAIRSHETELARSRNFTNPIEGVYLDSLLLDSCLVNGKNVVAIHVLNDSINGSDMVLIPIIWDISSGYYNTYSTISRYKALIEFDSTNIPLVIINTDEFGIPSQRDAPRVKAYMGIVDNGYGTYNRVSDEYNIYDGTIDLEIRGQSSNDFPKAPYRLELKDPQGHDTSVALLGMPKDEDWILYGPFADRSQIRNQLMFDLGRQLGHYQPRSKFCELILNGQDVGLYVLTETIKRGSDRINIAKLKNSDISGDDVTGGYIFKYDKENSIYRTIVYPDADSIQPEQKAYFNAFMKSYDSIFTSNKFINPGFRTYLDDTTLVEYIIMSELCKNADSYLFSTYCYKDRADKDNRVKFGPLWDYDLGFGNTHFQDGNVIEGWQWDINSRLGIRRILQDTAFVDYLQDRWFTLRESILSDENIYTTIDTMVNYIGEAKDRNYRIWPIIDKNPWSNNQTYMVSSYDEEIAYLKDWISTRTAWIDENMASLDGRYPLKVYSDIEVYTQTNSIACNVYPNPFSSQLIIEINTNKVSEVRIELSNILGQQFFSQELGRITSYQTYELGNSQLESLPTGIYFVRIYADNLLSRTIKVIKE